MSKSGSSLFPLRHVWFFAIPLLPLILGTVFLRSLIDPQEQLAFLKISTIDYLEKPIREFIHLGDMLIYSSFASIHVVVCIGVIVYFANMMRKLPSRACRKSVAFAGVIAISLIGLVFYFEWKANDLVIVQLGYKAICMAIETAELSTSLASRCFEEGVFTKLTLLAWIPTFSGMGAVVFAAGFAYGNADGLPAFEDAEWRTVFNERVKGLQKSLYAFSMVLVSSTIVITIFAHLPAGLLKDSSGLATAVSKYAVGLSTFWGALFSLTLAATFAAPAFLLLRQAYGYQSVAEDAANLRVWLHEHVFVSIKKQLVNVASLLAPLLVGPLSSLLASFASA
jgi:hypothetical protein